MDKEYWKNKTVTEAKDHLREHAKEGTMCPCCNQSVKFYKRSLTSSMAYGLILLSKAQTDEWGYVHLENYFKGLDCPNSIRGDIPKLRFWNLIEPKKEDREDGSNRNGYYRLTNAGKTFINNEFVKTAPQWIMLYNNKVICQSDCLVTIKDALKNKFNYNELMNPPSIDHEKGFIRVGGLKIVDPQAALEMRKKSFL